MRTLVLLAFMLNYYPCLAQVYVGAGIQGLEPEVVAGYHFKHMDVEAANYGKYVLDSHNWIYQTEEWTVSKGYRLTARFIAPLTDRAELTFGLHAVYGKYSYQISAAPPQGPSIAPLDIKPEEAWTAGVSIGLRVPISEHFVGYGELLQVDSPQGWSNFEGFRVNLSYLF